MYRVTVQYDLLSVKKSDTKDEYPTCGTTMPPGKSGRSDQHYDGGGNREMKFPNDIARVTGLASLAAILLLILYLRGNGSGHSPDLIALTHSHPITLA